MGGGGARIRRCRDAGATAAGPNKVGRGVGGVDQAMALALQVRVTARISPGGSRLREQKRSRVSPGAGPAQRAAPPAARGLSAPQARRSVGGGGG